MKAKTRWGSIAPRHTIPEGSLPAPKAELVAVVRTEFVDPSGIANYFRICDLTKVVDGELVSDCFA